MDQEQPAVWPPAPQGMEQTPSTRLSKFKPAPIQWVTWLTILSAGNSFILSVCDLCIGIDPGFSFFRTVDAAFTKPWNQILTAAFIAFLVWFYRVYKNLGAFDTSGLRYSAGWAVGWFFVPFFSLVRPYQMAQTIWKASSPDIDSRDMAAWQRVPNSGTITGWWALSILTGIIAFVPAITIYSAKAATPGYYLESAGVEAVSAATDVMVLLLIRTVSARQLTKARTFSASSENAA